MQTLPANESIFNYIWSCDDSYNASNAKNNESVNSFANDELSPNPGANNLNPDE